VTVPAGAGVSGAGRVSSREKRSLWQPPSASARSTADKAPVLLKPIKSSVEVETRLAGPFANLFNLQNNGDLWENPTCMVNLGFVWRE
jgi:hypothetical protein